MKFKNNKVSRINIAGIVAIIIMTIILLIGSCSFIIIKKLNYYKKATFGNTYIEDNYIGNLEYDKLEKKIDSMSDELVNKKIVLEYGDNQIETTYKDLGFKAQNNEIIKQIKSKQENMNIIKKIKHCFRPSKKEYKIKLKTDENKLTEYINNVKNTYDRGKTEEKFEIDENRNIKYIEGKSSLSLDVEKTKEKLLKDINSDKIEKNYKLVYQEEQVEVHDNYKYIDTKVSSFTTEFNPYISRGTNLRTGLSYIDGVILEPGEVFSFYKYAGPYNKRGYVFYYEFVGNGVCQIATTTYNAALLGGLEIVERYQHAEMVPYVAGGLDATVASYSSGWYVDMKFKNTYKYPIYISAYATGGIAHVDFWSNSNAKEGKTYQTESVKVSALGYKSYLHVYDSNGQEIEKRFLANSWYRPKQN